MLRKFRVKGFKSFEKEVELDLTNVKGYHFNEHHIVDGIVKDAVIFGKTGSGKTSLGLAILNITKELTDKPVIRELYNSYINGIFTGCEAEFSYEFKFDDNIVTYNIRKKDIDEISYESLIVNGDLMIEYNYNSQNQPTSNFTETSHLSFSNISKDMSIVKYITKNSSLDDNHVLKKLIDYANRVLWFRSIDANTFQGHLRGGETLEKVIESTKSGIKGYQEFLSKLGIEYDMFLKNENGGQKIMVRFPKGDFDYNYIASSGEKSLALVYELLMKIESVNASIIIADEFDAFYDFELSQIIMKKLQSSNAQTILSSHNTYLISNEYLRPDCYFLLEDNKVASLPNLTRKELRQGHSLSRMFVNGEFIFD